MNEHSPRFYEFEGFRLDATKRQLWSNGEVVPLMPKAFDVLLTLVSNHGRVVGKDELMAGVWRDAVVEENSLNVNVSALRKVFAEKPHDHRFIVTVPGVGYKFVAAVRELDGTADLEGTADGRAEVETGTSFPEESERSDSMSDVSGFSRLRGYVARHQSAAIAILIVTMGAVGGLLVLSGRGKEAENEKISVAVADFINETGETDLNGLSGILITSLEQSRRLSVVTRSRMFDILKQLGRSDAENIDETLGRRICERARVNMLVMASVRKFDSVYVIDLKVLDPQKDQYVFTASEKGEGKADIPAMIDRLSEATGVSLRGRAAEMGPVHKVADVTTPNINAYRHYFLGEQFLSQAKIDQAEAEFKLATALDPSFALAHYQLAYMRGWNNMDEAREPLRKAMELIERMPDKERLMVRAFNAYLESNFDGANATWRETVELYPDYKEAHWAFGDFSFHQGNYDTAVFHLEKVLELDPTFEPALGHLVWLSKEIEAHDQMVNYAKLLVERFGSENAYAWLCESQRVRRDFASAFETNRRILELFKDSPYFARCSGDNYLFMDEYGKAEAEYTKLIGRSRPLPHRQWGYRLLSLVYAYQGRYRDAERMSDQAIEVASKIGDEKLMADSYLEKAYLLSAGHGNVELVRDAISRQSNLTASAFGYSVMFNTLLLLGDYEKARPMAKKEMLAVDPFPDRIVNGYVHRAKGEYAAAIDEFETVVKRSLVIDKIMRGYELAGCYYETGDTDKAIDVLRKTQNLYSQMWPFYRATVYARSFYLLGKLYEKKGDQRLAVASYEKFLNLWNLADKDLPELVDAKIRLGNLKRALRLPLRAELPHRGDDFRIEIS